MQWFYNNVSIKSKIQSNVHQSHSPPRSECLIYPPTFVRVWALDATHFLKT